MSGMIRLAVMATAALVLAVVLLRPADRSASEFDAAQEELERFYAEAERRNRFLDGYQRLRDAAMGIARYHWDYEELPQSLDLVRGGMPEPFPGGPSEFLYDPRDGTLTMYFEGIAGLADGGVNYSPKVDEDTGRLSWECWTSHFADIESIIPTCVYYAP